MQSQLEALMFIMYLQEVGVIRPYPIEWKVVLSCRNINQHICCFLSQTDHLMVNDHVLIKFFVRTLNTPLPGLCNYRQAP